MSESHPYKDYATIQDRYAALGIRELVVFDPLLAGPTVRPASTREPLGGDARRGDSILATRVAELRAV